MSVNLAKGQNVNLSKEAPGVTTYIAGLSWDPRTTTGDAFDLDASAIAVDTGGQVLSEKHFVYFNNLTSPEGSVVHSGDNLTGEGGGDDEQITIDISKLPAEAAKIVFVVNIYDADARGQNFGQVPKSAIRMLDGSGTELARYDLGEDYSTETALVFGELYKTGDDWKFKAIGSGYSTGLKGIANDYGVQV